METKVISNIINYRYIKKAGKYVTEIGMNDQPKETIWITDRQLDNLLDCFDQTPKGYSNKHISVVGHWEGKYYRYASTARHSQPQQFKEPFQYLLDDLKEGN